MIQTILFDLDGTLIDTEPAAARAIEESFQSWGIRIDSEDSKFITGRTWATAFDFLFKKYSIPVTLTEAGEVMMEKYRAALASDLRHVPGSVEAVRALAEHYDLGLVSGSGRQEILWALNQLGIVDHFKIILGAEDYPRSKPAPDGYQKALGFFRADAGQTLIFEDSEAGIASAIAVGAWVVAISATNHFGQDTSRAHHSIPDLRCVNADWVKALTFR